MQVKLSAYCRRRLNSSLLFVFCDSLRAEGHSSPQLPKVGGAQPGACALILSAFRGTSFWAGGMGADRLREEGRAPPRAGRPQAAGESGIPGTPGSGGGLHVPGCSAPAAAARAGGVGLRDRSGEAVHAGTGSPQAARFGVGGGPQRRIPPSPAFCPRLTSPGQWRLPCPEPAPLRPGPHWSRGSPAGAPPGSSAGGGGFLDYDTGKLGAALRLLRAEGGGSAGAGDRLGGFGKQFGDGGRSLRSASRPRQGSQPPRHPRPAMCPTGRA